MKLAFRYATQDDLETIVNIYNEIIPSRLATADLEPVSVVSRQPWFEAFNHEQRPIWVMESQGKIAGWVSVEYFYGRPAYIHTAEISIYIDQNFRHQGLGQQALDFVFGQLKSLDINTLVAFIFGHNKPSLGLFEKNGFETWGRLPEVALMDDQKRDLDILGRHFS